MPLPADGSTTTVFGLPALTITPSKVWDALFNARYDPSGAGLVVEPADQAAADVMPTAEQFGCSDGRVPGNVQLRRLARDRRRNSASAPSDRCRTINPTIDFSQPPRDGDVVQSIFGSSAETATTVVDPNNETPTTISLFDGVVLIDGGAPAGAMEDAYQRLPGYNRVIVPDVGQDRGADDGDADRG